MQNVTEWAVTKTANTNWVSKFVDGNKSMTGLFVSTESAYNGHMIAATALRCVAETDDNKPLHSYPFARRRHRGNIHLRVDAECRLPRQRVAGEAAGAGPGRELHGDGPALRSGDVELHCCVVLPAHHTSV
ncbi:hypothetical protein ACJJTC_019683 [Scirpophaga incertulas]